MRKVSLFALFVFLMTITPCTFWGVTTNFVLESVNTEAEIRAEFAKLEHVYDPITYKVEPSLKAPYTAGVLSENTVESFMEQIAFFRYLNWGFFPELSADESVFEECQYGATLLAVNDSLTHFPTQPAGMSDEFFKTARVGTSTCIGWSSAEETPGECLFGWYADFGSVNLGELGHRKYVSSISYENIGFGYTDGYSTFLNTSKINDRFEDDAPGRCWPAAGDFPIEYFNGSLWGSARFSPIEWSIQLNSDIFNKPKLDNIEVTITRLSDSKSFTLDKNDNTNNPSKNDGNYLATYGSQISFFPDVKIRDGVETGSFKIDITGLKTTGGDDATLSYTVNFFNLEEEDEPSTVTIRAAHTEAEIRAKYEELKPVYSGSPFATAPSITASYKAGTLAEGFITDGLNRLNFLRYLAGLSNVTLNDEYTKEVQAGAVLRATGSNSSVFYPAQPGDMSDNFYKLAIEGCSNSSGNTSHKSLYDAVSKSVISYGSSAIKSVFSRRYALNPYCTEVGFGYATNASGKSSYLLNIKSVDTSVKWYNKAVCWPSPGAFPLEMWNTTERSPSFNYHEVWSFVPNHSSFANLSSGDIAVTLTRQSDGKSWTLDSSNDDNDAESGAYFHIDRSDRGGIANCLIFRPPYEAENYVDGESYTVEISGLYNKSGSSITATYTVDFFELD